MPDARQVKGLHMCVQLLIECLDFQWVCLVAL